MGTLSTVTRYLKVLAGVITEQAPITDSAGAGDADKIPALDATGRLSSTFMPVGITVETKSIQCTENLSAGNWINIYDVAGAFRCRKTDATSSGKIAHGFVLSAFTSGNNALVYMEGANTGVSGMLAGDVFLHTTAGAGTNTAPTGSGNVVQKIGTAVSATEVNFEPQEQIVLA